MMDVGTPALQAVSSAALQEVITSYMAGYPGELFEEPFVDFSTTRNYALRVCAFTKAACLRLQRRTLLPVWRCRHLARRSHREADLHL